MPLIFLVWVVLGWLQIVAAHTGGGEGFFNGLLRAGSKALHGVQSSRWGAVCCCVANTRHSAAVAVFCVLQPIPNRVKPRFSRPRRCSAQALKGGACKALAAWDLGLGTWDLGLGTWDLGLGTWDLGGQGTMWRARVGVGRRPCCSPAAIWGVWWQSGRPAWGAMGMPCNNIFQVLMKMCMRLLQAACGRKRAARQEQNWLFQSQASVCGQVGGKIARNA